MMPGGHLATSLTLSATTYYATGSLEASAGAFAGGFLIDVDHYLDYLVFEKQWRRPSPVSFLQYYFMNRPRRLVLPLHSAELLAFYVFCYRASQHFNAESLLNEVAVPAEAGSHPVKDFFLRWRPIEDDGAD